MELYSMQFFQAWPLNFSKLFSRFIPDLVGIMFLSLFWLNTIPLCGYTFRLFIHPVLGI